MKKYIMFALTSLTMASCMDTIVLPKDQTTGEDFWKEKQQVSQMVAGAYKSVCTEDVIERFIVWGDFRSDDLNELTSYNLNVAKENDLKKLNAGNVDHNCVYSNWASLYNVINRCNIVLAKAGGVVDIDPAYDLNTYYTDESQMRALRALCYFYLVRAFRDVPYSTAAVMNSSEVEELPQQTPNYVLDRCIADLDTALQHPLSSTANTGWRTTGLITRDAINAMLADIYLWRGSMNRNRSDYQRVIDYCDAVIDSKIKQYASQDEQNGGGRPGGIRSAFGGTRMADSEYPLIAGVDAYEKIFIDGNSIESILEFQMDGTNGTNDGLRNCYWSYDASNRNYGLMKAPQALFNTTNSDNSVYTNEVDYRFYENCFNVNSNDAAEMDVRKMIDRTPTNNNETTRNAVKSSHPGSSIGRPSQSSRFQQNWIAYRLTDIMLMKAEALVQLGDSVSLDQAFNLVREVNKRALADTTKINISKADLVSQEDYEQLVLAERQRELCFEGKRWFDLLRYNYRHTAQPAQPDKTLFQIANPGSESGATVGGKSANKESFFLTNYVQMMTLMQRKYAEGGAAIGSKMSTEAHLYLPILNSEVKVNHLLHQNPVYDEDDIYVKNND